MEDFQNIQPVTTLKRKLLDHACPKTVFIENRLNPSS
jgi:hypothetical protein